MSDSTEKSAYFYRIITLVVDVGTETLRDTFYSKVPKADVISKFSSPEIVEEFKQLKTKHVLNKEQYKQVTDNPDPDNYDITLLLILLTNEKISKIPRPTNGWRKTPAANDPSQGANLERLREIRNNFVGHRANTLMQETEFKTYWAKIEEILKDLAHFVNQDVVNKITQKIKDAETRILEPLNDRERKLLQVYLQWRKEEDEENQTKLTNLQSSLNTLHLKFDSLPKTSTDETNADIAITLSSVQSQVNIISEKIGGVAKQTDVQEVNQNVGKMADQTDILIEEVQTLKKQLEEYRKENEEIALKVSGTRSTDPQYLYQRQLQVSNPNAMSDKEIVKLSQKIGSEWERLAIFLDFTKAQCDGLKEAFPTETRIYTMLKKWHDVVEMRGENPKMLLAAAIVNASKNYSLAYTLVQKDSFNEKAEAEKSTADCIKQIVFDQGTNKSLTSHHETGNQDDVDGARGTNASITHYHYHAPVMTGDNCSMNFGTSMNNYYSQSNTTTVEGELPVTDSGQPMENMLEGPQQP